MKQVLDFVKGLSEELSSLKLILNELLKEESLIEDNLLTKKGFIIKKYSIKISALKENSLQKLKEELNSLKTIEESINYTLNESNKLLKEMEKAYNAYYKENLKLKEIIVQHMNNAFYLSKLAKVRVEEIETELSKMKNKKIHPETASNKVKKSTTSLEKMTAEILRFITLLEQLTDKLKKFVKESYYPAPRMYGRAVSAKELKNMNANNALGASKDPTPVFDCPPTVRKKISSMSKDERKNFFQSIGVETVDTIVFFQTALKPVIGPVQQKNGLVEYKFPKGIPVELLGAA